ncbi:MAG: transglycosylase SLT domain-containing protein [Candidatus Nanoarchaeia archaeon]
MSLADLIKTNWTSLKKGSSRAALTTYTLAGVLLLSPANCTPNNNTPREEKKFIYEKIDPNNRRIKNSMKWKDHYFAVAKHYPQFSKQFDLSLNDTAAALAAFTATESGGNPNAESGSGAKGLTQIIDSTGKGISAIRGYEQFPEGCTLDPAQNCYVLKGKTDNRTKPYISLAGGALVIHSKAEWLRKKGGFEKATPQDLLLGGITAYNTGEKCVKQAAEVAGSTSYATWQPYLTPELIEKCLGFDAKAAKKQSHDAKAFAPRVLGFYRQFRIKPEFRQPH